MSMVPTTDTDSRQYKALRLVLPWVVFFQFIQYFNEK